MDSRIINDTFEKEQHICAMCECLAGNHLIFHYCLLFENNPVCQDCVVDLLAEDAPTKVSTKLGRVITKEEIDAVCRQCGFHPITTKNLEEGGANEQQGPTKTR